jgi:hypothetical protein
MESSSNTESFIKNYFKIVFKPNETIDIINRKEKDLLESLMLVLLSGAIFLFGIFLVGDLIYNVFFEQYSTFYLEQITSGTLFGFEMSRYDFVFVFINELIFIMKSWLFFSIGFFLFMRLFGEKESIKDIMVRFSWVIYPYAWAIFGFNMLCWLFKFLLPLIYHYIFYVGLAVFFIVIVPITLQRFYNRMETEKVSEFKVLVAYYMVLFVAVLIYGYNHIIPVSILGFL